MSAALRASTVAPGRTAPCASRTVPSSAPRCSWAQAGAAEGQDYARASPRLALRFISPPPFYPFIAKKFKKDELAMDYTRDERWGQTPFTVMNGLKGGFIPVANGGMNWTGPARACAGKGASRTPGTPPSISPERIFVTSGGSPGPRWSRRRRRSPRRSAPPSCHRAAAPRPRRYRPRSR